MLARGDLLPSVAHEGLKQVTGTVRWIFKVTGYSVAAAPLPSISAGLLGFSLTIMASQPAQPPTQGQPYKITHDDIDDDVSVSSEDSEELRLAQEEWDEGLRQLQQLVSALLLPFFGKWLGRKWSYWRTYTTLYISYTLKPLSDVLCVA